MSRATFFIRGCPTCGRRLQIRVEHLGRMVQCKHCEAQFVAHDPSTSAEPANQPLSLLDRANQLLESFDESRDHPK